MSKSVWLVYTTLSFFSDHRISSQKKQKLFNADQRISIKFNKLNIGRKGGGGVVKDTRRQGRLRNATVLK